MAAVAEFVLIVEKIAQDVDFWVPTSSQVQQSEYLFDYPTESSLPVTYTATGGCVVTGDVVTFTARGTCAITATRAGDDTYSAVSLTKTVRVSAMQQWVRFSAMPIDNPAQVGDTYVPTVAALSNLPVTLEAAGACTSSGDTVTYVTAGQCTMTATQAGNDQYDPGQGTQTILVERGDQRLAFSSAPIGAVTVGDTYTPTIDAPTGLPVTMSTSPGCTVDGRVVTFTQPGTCSLTATSPGTRDYRPDSATQLINVAPAAVPDVPTTPEPTTDVPTTPAPTPSPTTPVPVQAETADSDGDGLSDAVERWLGTNPLAKDTDHDGLSDKVEVEGYRNTRYDKTFRSNPKDFDSDNDGLSDRVEVTGSANDKFRHAPTSPTRKDTDRDGRADRAEIKRGTNPALSSR